MTKVIVRYGIIAGLIVGIPMVAYMWWLPADAPGPMAMNMVTVYLVMLVALSMVFVGIKHYRDRVLGGGIKFVTALLVGLGITLVASVLYTLAWELSMQVSAFDFAAWYAKMYSDPVEAQEFLRTYSNPLYRMAYTFIEIFPVGVLVTLVSAAILRRRAPAPG
jgi:hypothetical protein